MRPKLLKASVIFALLAVLLGMPLLLAPHRIRPSSFARIGVGMTELEVEQLLGASAGNYDGYGTREVFFANIGFDLTSSDDGRVKTWASRHGAVEVHFDERQRLRSRVVYRSVPINWWTNVVDYLFPRPTPPPSVRDSLTTVG